MKKKLSGIIIICAVLIGGLIIYGIATAFDPQYSNAEIKQKIGGVLICNTVYYADHHSWKYDVNYSYKDNKGRIFKIGEGVYYGREWNKDEQLIPFKNWFILKTGGWYGTDKVIIGDSKFKNFTQYEFSPDSIEKDTIWRNSKIKSLKNYSPSEAFIKKIDHGQIELIYKFRIDESNTTVLDARKVIYEINSQTGKLLMIDVLKTTD